MGGFDWSGLGLWAMKFGVEDIEGLMDRLMAIRVHRPPEEDEGPKVRQ